MKEDRIYLEHILVQIEKIELSLEGILKQQFLANVEKQDANVRRLEIIGEAVKNLSLSFRKHHPQIEWREIAGTCDVLIHGYFTVDWELVWGILRRDVPILKTVVEEILLK
ncbi:DUF86 domain-containing protein, partial [Candidatus Woesearchaeota archaeon]|nr:DUF86 domain-containing protein [Candidatus Woesearchaeota archaeon]